MSLKNADTNNCEGYNPFKCGIYPVNGGHKAGMCKP